MEAIQCIKTRRSIRKFTQENISHELLEEIIGAASFAPSWKNTQVPRYIVVESKDMINKIAKDCVLDFEYNSNTIKNCAALVVMTVVKNRCGYERDGSFSTSKEDRWEMFDAGIAAQTFCLAAHDKGLGSVIMGIFDEAKVAEALNIPDTQKVAAIIPVGYPDISPEAPKRKTVEELVTFC